MNHEPSSPMTDVTDAVRRASEFDAQDKEYAADLLSDLNDDYPDNPTIVAQWFRKVRTETFLASSAETAEWKASATHWCRCHDEDHAAREAAETRVKELSAETKMLASNYWRLSQESRAAEARLAEAAERDAIERGRIDETWRIALREMRDMAIDAKARDIEDRCFDLIMHGPDRAVEGA